MGATQGLRRPTNSSQIGWNHSLESMPPALTIMRSGVTSGTVNSGEPQRGQYRRKTLRPLSRRPRIRRFARDRHGAAVYEDHCRECASRLRPAAVAMAKAGSQRLFGNGVADCAAHAAAANISGGCEISSGMMASAVRWKSVSEHGPATDGGFFRRLVLDDIPVFGQLPVLEAHDVHHDPIRRLTDVAEPAVEQHVVAVGDGEAVL